MPNQAFGVPVAKPFRVLVGVDLEDQASSGYALDAGLRMASRVAGSEVHAVQVVSSETVDEKAVQAAGLLRLYVSEKAAALSIAGPQASGIHVRRGDPATQIAQIAADLVADVIVVGAQSHVKSLFVGSTAERLLASAQCPVFVAGPKPRPAPSHVIVIDPPCPDCVQQRVASRGRLWWCARHSEHHHLRRRHVYSYQSELPFAEHDSEVIPTGVD
jgi:nucleotide-binding universal stress UspA family protein